MTKCRGLHYNNSPDVIFHRNDRVGYLTRYRREAVYHILWRFAAGGIWVIFHSSDRLLECAHLWGVIVIDPPQRPHLVSTLKSYNKYPPGVAALPTIYSEGGWARFGQSTSASDQCFYKWFHGRLPSFASGHTGTMAAFYSGHMYTDRRSRDNRQSRGK